MPASTTDYLDAAQELTQSALRWSEATVQGSTRAWLEMLDSLAPKGAGSESIAGLPKPNALMNAGLSISDELLAAQRDLATAFSLTVSGVSVPDAGRPVPAGSSATPATAAGMTPVAATQVVQAEVETTPVAPAEPEADELPFPDANTATIPQTLAALEDATDEELARFIAWERENKARKTLLGTLEG